MIIPSYYQNMVFIIIASSIEELNYKITNFHKSFITKNIILIFIYIHSTVKTNNIYCSAHMNQYTYIVVPFCLLCNIKTYFLYNKQKFQHYLFIVFIYPYISFYTLHHFRIAFTQVWKYILETCHNDNYWQWNIVGI